MVSIGCALSLGSWTAGQVFDLRAIRHQLRVIRPGLEWFSTELHRALGLLPPVRSEVPAILCFSAL